MVIHSWEGKEGVHPPTEEGGSNVAPSKQVEDFRKKWISDPPREGEVFLTKTFCMRHLTHDFGISSKIINS